MPTSRRSILRVTGAMAPVLLAGCLNGVLPTQRTSAPTATLALESQVNLPPCPKKPDSLTRDNVESFTVQFEKAHSTRVILRENEYVTYVQFKNIAGDYDGELNVDTTELENGFLVRFAVTTAYGYRPEPKTPETVHADLAPYTANYFVSNQRVVRAESEQDTTVDPREVGTEVHCPPE